LVLVCPVTSKVKGYPFEVPLPDDLGLNGVILADQLKSLDWNARGAELAATTSEAVVQEVVADRVPEQSWLDTALIDNHPSAQ
jgi:mRNA interferase MazF